MKALPAHVLAQESDMVTSIRMRLQRQGAGWCRWMSRRLRAGWQSRGGERGAVALTFLVSATLMLGGTFGAIDMIRYNVAQSRLQNALDAAVISAGRSLSVYNAPVEGSKDEAAWRNDAYHYFLSNMPAGFLSSQVALEDFHIEYIEERGGSNNSYLSGQFVKMWVNGELPLISTGYFKQTAWKLSASNQAVRRTRSDLELVMALDNTGSMDFDSPKRMTVLKQAAKDLVKTVLDAADVARQQGAPSGVYIGLVPFTDVVNVGGIASARAWLDYPAVQENYIRNLWSGCIVEPTGVWSAQHRLPASALTPAAPFQPLQLTYSMYYVPAEISNGGKLLSHTGFPGGAGILAGNNIGTRDRRVGAWADPGNGNIRVNLALEPEYCTDARVQFLNQDRAALNTAINAMKSYGATGVPVGLLWAWRMLHPAWRGAAGWGSDDMPRDPDPGRLNKVIVLLTDGDNAPLVRRAGETAGSGASFRLAYAYRRCLETQKDWWGNVTGCRKLADAVSYKENELVEISQQNLLRSSSGWSGSYNRQCPVSSLYMLDPRLAVPNDNNAACTVGNTNIGYHSSTENDRGALSANAFDSYLSALCTNVKTDGNGIRVYTVTLGKDVGQAAINLMRNCASGPGYFFDARNVSDLPEVFATIAGTLTELRLTD